VLFKALDERTLQKFSVAPTSSAISAPAPISCAAIASMTTVPAAMGAAVMSGSVSPGVMSSGMVSTMMCDVRAAAVSRRNGGTCPTIAINVVFSALCAAAA